MSQFQNLYAFYYAIYHPSFFLQACVWNELVFLVECQNLVVAVVLCPFANSLNLMHFRLLMGQQFILFFRINTANCSQIDALLFCIKHAKKSVLSKPVPETVLQLVHFFALINVISTNYQQNILYYYCSTLLPDFSPYCQHYQLFSNWSFCNKSLSNIVTPPKSAKNIYKRHPNYAKMIFPQLFSLSFFALIILFQKYVTFFFNIVWFKTIST